MFCQNCGTQIQDDSSFCSACGCSVHENIIVAAHRQIRDNNIIKAYKKLRKWSLIGSICAVIGILLCILGVFSFDESFISTGIYVYFVGVVITGWQSLHKWKPFFLITGFAKFIIASMIGWIGFPFIAIYYCIKVRKIINNQIS